MPCGLRTSTARAAAGATERWRRSIRSPRRGTASTLAERALELARDVYPLCRSITGDGVRETLRRLAPARAARDLRSAQRHAGVRLGNPARVESARRLDSHRRRSQAGRRRPACAARDELLGAGPCAHDAAGAATAPAHPAGASGLDSVSHQLLPRSLGLLRGPAGTRHLAGRRVRGRHRLDAGAGQPDLRRVLRTGRVGAGNTGLHAHLPSRAGQRQRHRHGGGGGTGRGSQEIAAESELSVRVRPRHNRLDRLAGAQRGAAWRACVPDW